MVAHHYLQSDRVVGEHLRPVVTYHGQWLALATWCRLGETAGWQRTAEDFYEKHDCPKQVWVRELVPRARAPLCAPILPAAWAGVEAAVPPRCTARVPQLRSLVAHMRTEVAKFRRAQALGYPLAGLLALIALAMFSRVRRGPTDLADYAAALSQGQLRTLRFRCVPGTRRVRCPERSTFERVLAKVDAAAVERAAHRAAAPAGAAQRQEEHPDRLFDQQPELGGTTGAGLAQAQA